MILKLNALDTLFFRDGKPFSMGADSFAQGIFPPPLSVIYGALRSKYLAEDMQEFQKLKLENIDSSLYIRINGFAYLSEETFWESKTSVSQIYFPVPLDLVQTEDEKLDSEAHLSIEIFEKEKGYFSNSSLPQIIKHNEQVEGLENSILNLEQLQGYINGSTNFSNIENTNSFVFLEKKVGNGLQNDTRSTDDSKLYQLKMNRFSKWNKDEEKHISTQVLSLLVDTNFFIEFENKTILKLGAEGKTVVATEFEESIELQEPTLQATKGSYFKIYFSTPVIFRKNGAFPDFIDTKTLKGEIGGIRVELISAFVGKYVSIGGFDLNKNEPKKMYKAAPAGSVYYFKVLEDTTSENLIKIFHNQKLSTIGKNEGFGLAHLAQLKFV